MMLSTRISAGRPLPFAFRLAGLVSATLVTAASAGVPLCCPADLSGDGIVDGADLAALLGNWGDGGIGDLDGSGQTDGADLAALLGGWGDCPSPTPLPPTAVDTLVLGCTAHRVSVQLFALGGSGDSVEWFANGCGGNPIATGPSFATYIVEPTTFYARWVTSCGASACTEGILVDYVDVVAPTSVTADPGSTIFAGEEVELTAHGGAGLQVQWVEFKSGQCSPFLFCTLATGPTYVVAPTETTTYCAIWTGTCSHYNFSPCASITITVVEPRK